MVRNGEMLMVFFLFYFQNGYDPSCRWPKQQTPSKDTEKVAVLENRVIYMGLEWDL